MSVLVTGAFGLIGYQIVPILLRQGREVVCYDRRIPPDASMPGAQVVHGDLNDHPRLYGTLHRFGVTEIVHAGAASGPMVESDNPYSVCQTNILGTVNVFEAARVFGVRRVIYCSSQSAYGTTDQEPTPETAAFHPNTVYGVTKATGDLLGTVYAERLGLDVVSLRFTRVYGPRRWTDCVLHDLVRDALDGRTTHLAVGAEQYYQYVYVKDIAQAIQRALDAVTLQQHAYNISGGERHSVAEIAAQVQKVLPAARIELGSGVDAYGDRLALLDISAAARDFGYRPAYGLERGIREYADWLETHAL